jgi:hypothetical protein
MTWPPYGWKYFLASVPRIGRIHPYWRFVLASNFPPQSAYLGFPKILTTVVYAVRRWLKRHYAAHYPSVLRGRTTGYQFRIAFTQKYFERISLQIVSLSVLWWCAFRDSSRSFWRSLKSAGLSGQRSDFGSGSMTLPALELKTHIHTHDWRSEASIGGRLQFPTLPKNFIDLVPNSIPRVFVAALIPGSAQRYVSGGPFFWRNYVQCLRVPHHHHRPPF